MNCSRDSTGKLCRRCKYVRKHFKNFVIKTLLGVQINLKSHTTVIQLHIVRH